MCIDEVKARQHFALLACWSTEGGAQPGRTVAEERREVPGLPGAKQMM